MVIYTTEESFNKEYASSLNSVKVCAFPSYFGYFRYSPEMRSALEQNLAEFDLVHLNNYWSYQNILAARYADKYGVPYVLAPHGSLPIMMRGYLRKWAYEIIYGRNILKKAAKIIAVSKMEYDQAISRGVAADKIKIIPNAIDLSLIPSIVKGSFRKKYEIKDREKVILFLARIHPIKGVDLLVRAFAELCKTMNDVKLVIVGPDDGYLATLRKMIGYFHLEGKVLLTGPLYEKEKYAAYSDSDIYVLPSKYDIFAITILEAFACGLPVIITENQGLAEYVKDRAGEVIRYNWQDLMRALEKLLGNNEKKREYGRNAKIMVNEYFNWDKIIDLYEEAYLEVLNRGMK